MNTKYTKEQLQKVVMESENITQCLIKLGLKVNGGGNHKQFKKNIERFNIDISHFKGIHTIRGKTFKDRWVDPEIYFTGKQIVNSHQLKKILIRHGLKEKKCEKCNLSQWNNLDIPLQLHHKDGNHQNNKLDNLEILCANCHAQTDTFCKSGRNFVRVSDQTIVEYIPQCSSISNLLRKLRMGVARPHYDRVRALMLKYKVKFNKAL